MGLDMFAMTMATAPTTPVDFQTKETETSELHYWRKHPNLHGFMESLYYSKGGKEESFNCVNVQLDANDLDHLEKCINENSLPQTSGFFFGYSRDDKKDDLQFVKSAREAIANGQTVFYTSWW